MAGEIAGEICKEDPQACHCKLGQLVFKVKILIF